METDIEVPNKVVEDPLNIEGEEIPETFPGHENVPRVSSDKIFKNY